MSYVFKSNDPLSALFQGFQSGLEKTEAGRQQRYLQQEKLQQQEKQNQMQMNLARALLGDDQAAQLFGPMQPADDQGVAPVPQPQPQPEIPEQQPDQIPAQSKAKEAKSNIDGLREQLDQAKNAHALIASMPNLDPMVRRTLGEFAKTQQKDIQNQIRDEQQSLARVREGRLRRVDERNDKALQEMADKASSAESDIIAIDEQAASIERQDYSQGRGALITFFNGMETPFGRAVAGLLHTPGTKAFEASKQRLIADLKKTFGANVSTVEFESFLNLLPKLGEDPRATKYVLDFMKRNRKLMIDEYDAALQLQDDEGFLPGNFEKKRREIRKELVNEFNADIKSMREQLDSELKGNKIPGKIRVQDESGKVLMFPDTEEVRNEVGRVKGLKIL